jgi:hypothetical protein
MPFLYTLSSRALRTHRQPKDPDSGSISAPRSPLGYHGVQSLVVLLHDVRKASRKSTSRRISAPTGWCLISSNSPPSRAFLFVHDLSRMAIFDIVKQTRVRTVSFCSLVSPSLSAVPRRFRIHRRSVVEARVLRFSTFSKALTVFSFFLSKSCAYARTAFQLQFSR